MGVIGCGWVMGSGGGGRDGGGGQGQAGVMMREGVWWEWGVMRGVDESVVGCASGGVGSVVVVVVGRWGWKWGDAIPPLAV